MDHRANGSIDRCFWIGAVSVFGFVALVVSTVHCVELRQYLRVFVRRGIVAMVGSDVYTVSGLIVGSDDSQPQTCLLTFSSSNYHQISTSLDHGRVPSKYPLAAGTEHEPTLGAFQK